VDPVEIERRLTAYHAPYHSAFEDLATRQSNTVICAIHSFTPQLKDQPKRPWQIGILSANDKRFTAPLIAALNANPLLQEEAQQRGEPLCIGDNAPYIGYFPGDAIDTHATPQGRANVLIELRSDLIETPAAQRHWAGLLAPILEQTLTETGL
jgi:predicted N-formylglutamate amidohydrolase